MERLRWLASVRPDDLLGQWVEFEHLRPSQVPPVVEQQHVTVLQESRLVLEFPLTRQGPCDSLVLHVEDSDGVDLAHGQQKVPLLEHRVIASDPTVDGLDRVRVQPVGRMLEMFQVGRIARIQESVQY